MKQIDRPVRFLVEHGIMFELNRQVLHPLGMQLNIQLDEQGDGYRVELLDNRASPTPITFSREEYEEGREQYELYLQEHGKKNMQKRRRVGAVIQTGPNVPHHVEPEDSEQE